MIQRRLRREEAAPPRPAFYALSPGGWRDYWSLLHPPYTLWHLSYAALGAAVAPRVDGGYLAATVVAFFLGVGVTAHALDELRGRPLRTRIPPGALMALAAVALAGAVALGALGAARVSWWLLAFVGFGAFIVLAYNLELLGGWFHNDLWFGLSWGAFPVLTAYFAQAATIRWPAVLVALAAFFLTLAQRRLSTPVRDLRRRVAQVEGRIVYGDGTEAPMSAATLRLAPEAALRTLSLAMPLLAGGMVAARFL